MSRYNLGTDLKYGSPEYIEFWGENRYGESGRRRGRRAEEYWAVADRNLGEKEAITRLMLAHDIDPEDCYREPWVKEEAFVTDDHDLASELIRVIGLDFVFDFKSRLFIFDLFGGHEITMTCLMEAIDDKGYRDYKDGAEAYIEKGLGCYMSSQYPTIWLGEDVSIPQVLMPFKKQIKRL